MQIRSLDAHPTEDVLEDYSFNRLSCEDAAAAEEHLLECAECQESLAEIDEYILLMKAAMAEPESMAAAGAVFAPARRSPPARLWSWARTTCRGPAWAPLAASVLALLLLCVTAMATWRSGSSSASAQTVPLETFRGSEALSVSRARSKTPLNLTINIKDLPAGDNYRMEAVTARGARVWDGPGQMAGGALSAHIPKGLSTGIYWVRLYSSSGSAQPTELLREFGLRIE